jgi:hypothetical protein
MPRKNPDSIVVWNLPIPQVLAQSYEIGPDCAGGIIFLDLLS